MDGVVTAVGWAGAGLLLAAYALASAERIAAGGHGFQVMNLLGALALTINSGHHRAWPSAILNVAWIAIGLVTLGRRSLPATASADLEAPAAPPMSAGTARRHP
ncbi:CBU_0592 family membrane protein [Catenulispora subtropica]|uniref:CBU-0592-like domain-containing protein n=1 Tax=Catenulispora subtropica TaxID=450798 RepID=A0ABP5CBT6_9ACTN